MSRVALVWTLVLAPTVAHATDFTGDYAPSEWDTTGISEGTAEIDLVESSATQLVATYDVDLGGGGVSQRTVSFGLFAPEDGLVTVDWEYRYLHAWFLVTAEITFFYYDASGNRVDFDTHNWTAGGEQTFTGTLVDMPIRLDRGFGFEVGGSNFDSNSWLQGTVTLTNFDVGAPPTDCNGVAFGIAVEDMCGTCDADATNDCEQDCAGDWGGTATEDMCGTCDADAGNDCEQDCNGDWGGSAMEDGCGTCDADPTNDCEQDCNGDWDGPAVEDMCGTCDADPTNDCEQDCKGDWGGTATEDDCADEKDGAGGCGCDAGSSGGGWAMLALVPLALRRRRR